MRLGLALAFSTLLHVGGSWALLMQALAAELPEPFDPGDRIICVFPPEPFDYRALFLGLTEPEVRRSLGSSAAIELNSAAGCVRYKYRSGSEITVFFSQGLATAVAFGPSPHGVCGHSPVVVSVLDAS